MHQHRAGKLKQQNKGHKTTRGKASKRALDRNAMGRVEVGQKGAKHASSGKSRLAQGKQARYNQAVQQRKVKRDQLLVQRRIGHGGVQGPPHMIGVFYLGPCMEEWDLTETLGTLTSEVERSPLGQPATLLFRKQKERITVFSGNVAPLKDALSTARVCDIVVMVIDARNEADDTVSEDGYSFLTALKASGMPAAVGVTLGLPSLNPKRRKEKKKWATRLFDTELGPDVYKFAEAENAVQVLRALTTVKPRNVTWRMARPYLVAWAAQFEPDASRSAEWQSRGISTARQLATAQGQIISVEEEARADAAEASGEDTGEVGHWTLEGFVRGCPLHVDQPMHVPGVGTFRIRSIHHANDPFPLRRSEESSSSTGSIATRLTTEPLDTLVEPDTTSGEQTWPTPDELHEAEQALRDQRKKATRRMRSKDGYDSFADAWMVGNGEEDEEEGEDGAAAEGTLSDDDGSDEEDDDGDDDDDVEDAEVTQAELDRERRQRHKEEQDELEFPDEVETPLDQPARERFAKYRGLPSVRTSPWNPMENLPRSYSRVVRFQNFDRTSRQISRERSDAEAALESIAAEQLASEKSGKAKAAASSSSVAGSQAGGDMADDDEEGTTVALQDTTEALQDRLGQGWVPAGSYLRVELEDVPLAMIGGREPLPLAAFGLLRLEHKTSVMHFNLMRQDDYEEPIKSKDTLEFHVGFRSFAARPIFSQRSLNCDRHKFERYFQHGRWTMATALLPVAFPPIPVLVFKRAPCDRPGELGPATLVATGTALGADPNQIILKKILLTGYPVSVKRRTATIKYMFFSPEDWFQPVELHTKYGRIGAIKEPIGTHGLMKCSFNQPITAQDTVCMPLYKRVYPKWGPSYRPLVGDEWMEEGAPDPRFGVDVRHTEGGGDAFAAALRQRENGEERSRSGSVGARMDDA